MKYINPQDAQITILTKEQVEKLPRDMLKKGYSWWLCSPFNSCHVRVVAYDGWAGGYDYVDCTYGGVVPAFVVDNLDSKFGEKVRVGRITCTVIGTNLVLSDEAVCQHRYDAESSDWENSELKAFIESEDFFKEFVRLDATLLSDKNQASSDKEQLTKLIFDSISRQRKQLGHLAVSTIVQDLIDNHVTILPCISDLCKHMIPTSIGPLCDIAPIECAWGWCPLYEADAKGGTTV